MFDVLKQLFRVLSPVATAINRHNCREYRRAFSQSDKHRTIPRQTVSAEPAVRSGCIPGDICSSLQNVRNLPLVCISVCISNTARDGRSEYILFARAHRLLGSLVCKANVSYHTGPQGCITSPDHSTFPGYATGVLILSQKSEANLLSIYDISLRSNAPRRPAITLG